MGSCNFIGSTAGPFQIGCSRLITSGGHEFVMSELKIHSDIKRTDAAQLASRIQSTIISNALTRTRWERRIAECLKYHFHAAMIPPAWVKRTADALHGSGTRVASFVDFPYGTMTSAGKAYETAQLVANGAEEVDLMPNVGFLLSGMEREYADDIAAVVKAAGKAPVKSMLELPLLNAQQKRRAIALSVEARGVVPEKRQRRSSWDRHAGRDWIPAPACSTQRWGEGFRGNQNCAAGARSSGSRSGPGWNQRWCSNHARNRGFADPCRQF